MMLRGALASWLLAIIGVAAQSDTNRDDSTGFENREILLAIFQATGGFSWLSSTNWVQQGVDVCNWSGVRCYPEDTGDARRVGHIQELNLKDNRLVGTLPSVVFEIPYLETLNIEDNADVTMDLSNIGRAQFLKELDISNTGISNIGGIGSASNLEVLHLTGLNLQGSLPQGLYSLTALEHLYANDNSFDGVISTNIGRLTALREIYLGNSDLTGQIPESLGSLTLLEVLSLFNNAFGGSLPQALNALTNLRTVALQQDGALFKGNGISGSVPAFSQHAELTEVHLQNQQLSGTLDPNFLIRSPEGETINVDLRSNDIIGIVPSSLRTKMYLNLLLAGNQITNIPNDLINGNLCPSISSWMNGDVQNLGCDSFLCPPGFWAPEGRATRTDTCTSCPDNSSLWGRTVCGSTTTADVNDRQVLAQLYNAMGGRNWKNDDNWLSLDGSVCDWYGISCTNGLVSTINLRNNGLSGTPPIELFSLSALRTLNLEMNDIAFSFKGIGSLSSLQVLNLASTNLPVSSLSDMEELQSLSSLSVLSLDSNNLGGNIPPTVFALTGLQELNIGHNGFTGSLDSRIGDLSLLQRLYLDGNSLSGQIPSQIGNLVNVQEIFAGENQFGGTLPAQLNLLTNLRSLALQQIVLSGGIGGTMPSFSNLSQLTSLQLASNQLTGSLPPSLLANRGDFSSLITIDLSDNLLEGAVPSQWSQFDRMIIDLTGNKISSVPPSICQKQDWMQGDVGRYGCDAILCPRGTSNSSGRKSDTMSECTSCPNGGTAFLGAKSCSSSSVEFGTNNGSEASILSDFFAATHGNSWNENEGWNDSTDVCNYYGVECDGSGRVLKIDLTDNGLKGSVPKSIFKMTELSELTLSKNAISITFDDISEAVGLTTLKLDDVNIESITGIGNGSNLATLSLIGNDIKGEIPFEIYLLSNLRELDLGYNMLTGRIPNLVGALTSLEILRLYHNHFTGRIPAALGDLTNLRELNLAENNFEGTIPEEFNDLTNLRFLSLQREGGILGVDDVGIIQGDSSALGPGLIGPVPSFSRLSFLSELYLGVNSLTGSIPFDFLDGITDTLSEIKVDLTSNQLTGTVPGSLTQFENISLYIADNQITSIASSLCSKPGWLNGDVAQYQCDGILCPAGTFNSLGRKSSSMSSSCEVCISDTSGFLGSTECLSQSEQLENAERAVLEKLYRQMNGDNWLINTNWMDPDISICNWYGIECQSTTDRTVVSIDLENNRLLNNFVIDLWTLPNLRKLNLKKNEIEQLSLFGIQNAANLEYLDFSNTGLNSLAGISGAANLRVLRAEGNNLGAFPNEIYSLVNLETLTLSDNPFSQLVVPDLQVLSRLTHLSLQNCGLRGLIPAWVGSLSGLEYLDLGRNALMGNLPSSLLQLVNLKRLDLSDQISNGGALTGNLLDFANSTNLSEIFLQHNSFEGAIPSTMLESYSGTSLVTLDLRYNQLSGEIPRELIRIDELNLYLSSNQFSSLPQELCNSNWNDGNTGVHGCDGILCERGTFNAYGRAIGGLECITCDFPFMTSVLGSTTCGPSFEHTALISFYQSTGGPKWKSANNWLNIEDHCQWEGITCHAQGEFEGLVKSIELEENNLVGTADIVRIWQLEGLELVNLQKNDISIPFTNIENAINLQVLLISQTLTSTLLGIENAVSLKELHLTNAGLFGLLPIEISNLSNLERLYLSQNGLTGSLPSEIGRLTQLEDLYLFNNNMRGTLPSEIGLLGQLQHLSLGKNNFAGTIPRQINSLARLEMLSIEKEEDPEPDGFFAVGGGGLGGTLPALSGLPNLKEVYLGHNSFTGTIPGNFMQGITNKADQIVVDLSYNNLLGPIPTSFSNFGDLRLELGRNQISEIPDVVCARTEWFNGEVANGCDAILCAPGTFNEYGRRIDLKTICRPCTYPGSAVDYGAVSCGPVFADEMTDREILLEFYDATGGSDWVNSIGWNGQVDTFDGSFCEWHGITCEPLGEFGLMTVTEISLMENNLNGLIPSILFHLPQLRKLDVRNNAISIGMNAIFQAEFLEELYLDRTRVTSLEGIGQATSLRVLHLHKNSFGWIAIPDELFDLTNLEDLNLSDSMFGGSLSTKIGQLRNVKRLSLLGNALSGQIPSEIGNLVSVEDLDLSDNNWHGTLPSTFNGLSSLVRFGLSNNNQENIGVTGQLHSFSTMPDLTELYLSGNQFTGSIPSDFLSGISDKSSTVNVFLDGNHLGGTVPSSLTALERVNIYLQDNLISGFGSGICEQGEWMDGNVARYGCDAILCPAGRFSPTGRQVSETTACTPCPDLSGSPTLGSDVCISIQKDTERDILLNLFQSTEGINWKNNDNWNDPNVDICDWYGIKCKQGATVESILLGSNRLVGTIPTSIYQFPNLKFLWLYSNPVTLPFDGIAQATSLTSLLLDSTKIKTLNGLGAAHSLIDVDVRFNNLRGPLPTELSNLGNLQSFTCSENAFNGKVPELTALRKLTTLRMSNNAFTGPLPSFSQHPALRTLDLSGNQLTGPVPENLLQVVSESETIFLDLSGNRLSGTVPGELSRFAEVTILLRNNRISGINENLCEQKQWNRGDVGSFECDAILCPKGTYSPSGRESEDTTCKSCSKNKFLGGTTCGGSSASASIWSGSISMLLTVVVASTVLLLC